MMPARLFVSLKYALKVVGSVVGCASRGSFFLHSSEVFEPAGSTQTHCQCPWLAQNPPTFAKSAKPRLALPDKQHPLRGMRHAVRNVFQARERQNLRHSGSALH